MGLFLLSVTVDASVLNQSYNSQHYSQSEFRLLKRVRTVTQDNEGFLWIGTSTGLYQFDGHKLRNFNRDVGQAKGLPHFHVNSLVVDDKGFLWIGTTSGLAKFSLRKQEFAQVKLQGFTHRPVISTMHMDSKQRLWIGTRENGVVAIDKNGAILFRLNVNLTKRHRLNDNYVKSITEDNNGNIWIGTISGINRYSLQDDDTEHYDSSRSPVYSIKLSPTNQLLAAGRNGLLKFSIAENKFIPFETEGFALPDAHALSIDFGAENQLIVGTNKGGLAIYDPRSRTTQIYQQHGNYASQIASDHVSTTFLDGENHLWIGGDKGISKLNFGSNAITLYRSENNNKKCLSGNESYSLFQDNNNRLFISILGEGLHILGFNHQSCKIIRGKKLKSKKYDLSYITDITEDENGQIWIGTYQNGLFVLEPETLALKRISTQNQELTKLLASAYVNKLSIDASNDLWIAVEDVGLVKLDIDRREASVPGLEISKFLGVDRLSIKTLALSESKVWLGTTNRGLIAYGKYNGIIKQFIRPNMESRGIPETIISLIKADNDMLWMGSKGYGIYSFDLASEKIARFTQSEGLPNNVVWSIASDNANGLWLGTENGLARFDTKTHKIRTFYEADGIQDNEATTAISLNLRSNILWYGGVNGFNKIMLDETIGRSNNNALITNASAGDLKLNIFSKTISKRSDISVAENEIFSLPYNRNNLAFAFVNIEYDFADQILYKYRLKGYENWKIVSQQNASILYSNIPPGQYIFELTSKVAGGAWSDSWQVVPIRITEPWWQTIFAYMIYAILFIFSVYLIVFLKTRSIERKASKLELLVSDRTTELNNEKSKVEILLKRKEEEFSNISHELRTPLTLILGPVKQLLKDTVSNKANYRLNVIQRNAFQLMRLTEQILMLKSVSIDNIARKRPQSAKRIIQHIAEAFYDLAIERDIDLVVGKIEDVNFELTENVLEQIVLNLLSNAIKYTERFGQVSICSRRRNDILNIIISDSGVGIDSKSLEIIFDKYTRLYSHRSSEVIGSGIGLFLVKKLVESQGGNIEVTSELGVGSTFSVSIPITNEVESINFEPNRIDEDIDVELHSFRSPERSNGKSERKDVDVANSSLPVVLVVEDNYDMRKFIVESISDEYRVIEAADGQAGMVQAVKEVPDLVISDIMMPISDGYELTKSLRSDSVTNHIPVILLTARGDRHSKLKGWQENVDEYLIKPFDTEELVIRIRNLIEIRDILKKSFSSGLFCNDDIDTINHNEKTVNVDLFDKYHTFIKILNETLEARYCDPELSISKLASLNNMSLRQLFRKLRNTADMTPAEYLRRFRLEKSKQLLNEGKSVSYVAMEVGFSSHSYFGKCFKAYFGIPPSEYQGRRTTSKYLSRAFD